MGCELHPVILYHAFESVVAAEGGQSALSSYGLDVAAYDVLQAVFLEGAVLVPNHLELSVNLPEQKAPLDNLKGEVIEPKQPEISPYEKGILIWS